MEEAMGKQQERENHEAGVGQRREVPVFTIDPLDVLDCSVCCHPLRPPIFQCMLGHTICSSCHDKLPGKCCFCSVPTVYNRCHRLEDVVESIKIACRNGCTARITYYQQEDHEKDCPHAPCFCDIADCNFSGPKAMLLEHFSGKHKLRTMKVPYSKWFMIHNGGYDDAPASIVLVGEDGHFFVLSMKLESFGGIIGVCCVQPNNTGIKFKCRLRLAGSETHYFQITEFQTRNTNLYDGFPGDCFSFLVPKVLLPGAGTSAKVLVGMELTPE